MGGEKRGLLVPVAVVGAAAVIVSVVVTIVFFPFGGQQEPLPAAPQEVVLLDTDSACADPPPYGDGETLEWTEGCDFAIEERWIGSEITQVVLGLTNKVSSAVEKYCPADVRGLDCFNYIHAFYEREAQSYTHLRIRLESWKTCDDGGCSGPHELYFSLWYGRVFERQQIERKAVSQGLWVYDVSDWPLWGGVIVSLSNTVGFSADNLEGDPAYVHLTIVAIRGG